MAMSEKALTVDIMKMGVEIMKILSNAIRNISSLILGLVLSLYNLHIYN